QGLTLNVGASCHMSFAFTPNAAGGLTDASIGSWNGQNFNIALHGVGKNPVFRITPSAIDFGDVQTGNTAASQTISITNLSPVPVVMSGAGGAPPTGQFGGVQACQGLTLASGSSCSMSFAFSAAALGILTDASMGSWNQQAYHISLLGNSVAPHFHITPFALDFGLVPVGITGPAQSVSITNDGLAAVVMSGAGGAPPTGRFGGVQACQGLTLARDASCTMSFAFSPNAAALLTDASIGSWNAQDFNIALQGTGFSNVSAQTMDLSPATISLSGTVTTSAVLLSTATFDATTVSLPNVRMLVNGTTDVAPVSRGGVVVTSVRDWNGDGRPDRMLSFQTTTLVAAGLHAGGGADVLVLHDEISATKWRAFDAAPPTYVP
ncbi:MAG TPA: choice-of-anchor D domain-containing protein, partial [Gemmatimonadaceae bacterium]|nr:choice-of-anchor D domain-containing protein [Gemmatimonadaceae bacterium]